MSILALIKKQTFSKGAVNIKVYAPECKPAWDNFIANSKNGTFLFYRNYMDYHSNRFIDHSLMFYQDSKLVALMPANIRGDDLFSHEGLTFGGVISSPTMTTPLMLKIFEKLKQHCRTQGLTRISYKAIPPIYHSVPADEDLYALFLNGARLTGRNAASCIYLPQRRRFRIKRREAIKKAQRNSLVVKQSSDIASFMRLVEQVLKKHDALPVHSAEEMMLLVNRFPDNIKLFCSYKGDAMLAGCLMYESKNVAHGQYAANSVEGRLVGAQDIIIDYLINKYYKDKAYFDFGISTLNLGRLLNEGLIAHKESFGASTVVYDSYELTV